MSEPAAQRVLHLPDLDGLAPGTLHRFALTVTQTADGTELCLPVNVLAGRVPHPRLLMVAGVHGDEYEGITAQLELWHECQPANLLGTVVMVPVANPPAFRALRRRNPSDDIDMNRVFPGNPDGSITERLAHRLFQEVLPGSDLLLSMHGWTFDGVITPYVEYPKDSPLSPASRAAAVAFGLDYLEAFDWHPGLLVAVANRAGVPAIEPEIGGQGITLPERRQLYRRGALNLMRHLGVLPGPLEGNLQPREVRRQWVTAPVGGVLLRHVEPGQAVKAGERVATITDLNGCPVAELAAPADGLVATVRMQAAVEAGEAVLLLFEPQA